MTSKNINVVLCCYQGELYIAEQLDSILAQDYPLVDIHVSDDCSDDNTCSIIEDYCSRFPNISLHRNQKNLGFLKNFEESLLRIEGEYFALCDQDDIWHPKKLSLCMQELKFIEVAHPDIPILVHSDLELINEEGVTIGRSFFQKKGLSVPQEKSLSQVLGHCGIMGNTLLINRSLVDRALPFPEGLKYHDYWFALINECFGVRRTIFEKLVKYRLHQKNTSNNNITSKSARTLPYMQDNRQVVIGFLLETYELEACDRRLVEGFYKYLVFERGRLSHFIFLFKNGFFKSSPLYQIISFYKIMTAKYR